MHLRISTGNRLGIVLAAGMTASMVVLLPVQALNVAAKSYPTAPVLDQVTMTMPVTVADEPATDPANPTAEAPGATDPSVDVAAPETDQRPPVPPGGPRPVTAQGPPRGPVTVQGPKGAAVRRLPIARAGAYPRRVVVARPVARPVVARPVVARAPISRAPAVAPRLPNSGTGGLLDQQSAGSSMTPWALAGLLLGSVALGGMGIFAVRRQR